MGAWQPRSAFSAVGQFFRIVRVRAQKGPVAAILIDQDHSAVQMREPAPHQLLRCESFLFGVVEDQVAKSAEQMGPAPFVFQYLLQKDLHLQTVVNQRLLQAHLPERLADTTGCSQNI